VDRFSLRLVKSFQQQSTAARKNNQQSSDELPPTFTNLTLRSFPNLPNSTQGQIPFPGLRVSSTRLAPSQQPEIASIAAYLKLSLAYFPRAPLDAPHDNSVRQRLRGKRGTPPAGVPTPSHPIQLCSDAARLGTSRDSDPISRLI
jgi:hypothetical protein